MSFPQSPAPTDGSCRQGGERAGLDSPTSIDPVDHGAYVGSSRGHSQASPFGDTRQGTGSICASDCFGPWCCLEECDCECHDPETVFSGKTPHGEPSRAVPLGFNSRKNEDEQSESGTDEFIPGSCMASPEPESAQEFSNGMASHAVLEHPLAPESRPDADGSESESGPKQEWPDCKFRGRRVIITYTPKGDPVTVPLTCEGMSKKEWCEPCVAHRHLMLVARYRAQSGHESPRTSVVVTLPEKDDIEKWVECVVGVARRTDGRDVAYARPLYETKRGDYRVMVVFDQLLSDRAHELMHRKLRRWPTMQVRQRVVTGDDFSAFLRKLRREGGANTTSWSQNWAKLQEAPRYLTAGGSISVPEQPVLWVEAPLYYHEWRKDGEPGSLAACQLWVSDHVSELPDESRLVEWGRGPRYKAKAALRRWVAETRYSGNWKYLLHAAEAYTGMRAMRDCYRPLLEGWKPEPGWFDAPLEDDPVDDGMWDDAF